jgi:PAS domain S-box-containing protein
MMDEKTMNQIEALRREIAVLKQAAEERTLVEEQYKTIIRTSMDGFLLVDTEGRFLDVNDAYCHMIGYSRDELLKMRIQDIEAVESPEETAARIRKLMETGSDRFETRHRHRDGRIIDIEVSVNYIKGDEGMLFTFLRDITERKVAEKELKLKAELLDAAGDSIFLHDTEGNLIYVNKTAYMTRGYSREELLAMNLRDLDTPEYAKLIEPRMKTVLEKGESVFEAAHFRKDRSVMPIEVHVRVIEHEGRRLVVGVTRDITERKQAEAQLRLFRELLDQSIDSIYIVEPATGRFLDVNQAACRDLGYTRDELLQRRVVDIQSQIRDIPAWQAHVQELRAKGQNLFEFEALRKDGSHFPVEVSTRVVTAGNESYVVAVVRNITEHKKAEEEKAKLEIQFHQASKMEAIGQLASGIAHDFNNILNAIIGFGSLLKMDMDKDSPLMSHVGQILDAAERAAMITHQLLAFSRKQVLDIKPVNINDSIRNIEKLLLRLIREDIKLKFMLHEKDMTIMADNSQIDQILINIATNARDAMPKGGMLTIATEPVEIDSEFVKKHGYGEHGMYVRISAMDTGIGMDEKTRERIFEPFFTTKELGKGTGLGLSVVYGIVKQHNGYINVYSELGMGTTFKIYLPLIKTEAFEEQPSEAVPVRGGTETILVAEDDPGSRKLAMAVLEKFGYSVIAAENGEEAVNRFIENKDLIRLVILDVIMPEKGGREAYDEIKNISPDIKVMFLSGYTGDILSLKGINEKEFEFISKPVSPNVLLRKVREVLDR